MFHSMHVAPFVMFHCSCVFSLYVCISFLFSVINAFYYTRQVRDFILPCQSCNEPLEAVCISTRVYLGLGILFAFFSRNFMIQFTLSSVLACYVVFLLKICFQEKTSFSCVYLFLSSFAQNTFASVNFEYLEPSYCYDLGIGQVTSSVNQEIKINVKLN